MGNPREVLDRIKAIVGEKSDDDVKTLIAIDNELGDANAMNEWSPRDAAYWASKPVSERGAKLHAFIQETGYRKGQRQGYKWGAITGAVLVGLVWLMWGRSTPTSETAAIDRPATVAQEVQAIDGKVLCYSYRDWLITEVSGPCSDFKELASIAVGQTFFAQGSAHKINIIVPTPVAKDYADKNLSMKKGEWYCQAAESQSDLDVEGSAWRRIRLFIPRCRVVR
jgi:hypothetical protein